MYRYTLTLFDLFTYFPLLLNEVSYSKYVSVELQRFFVKIPSRLSSFIVVLIVLYLLEYGGRR